MSIELLVHPSPSPAGPSKSISPTTSAPPPPPSATSVTPAPSQKKPRSKRTPSPPPPLPAAPLQTIRLEIKLGGPTNYEVDISKLAKETGQRAPSPVRVLPGVSEGEGAGKGKKRKKKAATSEYYDISDPFIDDSELALDDRKWFAQTKQQGFYVSSGEVALLKDRSPKKPKSKKNPLIPTSASIAPPKPDPSLPTSLPLPGSISAPPNLNGFGGEEDEKAGQKRKRYVTVVEGGKKRKVVDVNSFHPELQAGIEELKKAIAAESWAQKGKFPPNIKPLLAKLAMDAIKLDEYDEHFFNLMPTLFPYNKFTMMKLIKRTVFQDHVNLLMERQDTLLAELTELVKEGFAKAEEEYEKAKIVWDKRQEKAKVENPSGSSDPVSTTPTRHTTEEMDVDNPPASTAGAGHQEKEHENKPPQKRYRLSDRMKTIVWQLVCLSNECCRLENEKNGLEGSVIQVSEQGGRKALYQKIVAAFPDGWMNSGQISRDVSVMKKKFEKEQMENET
ncbi:hypothetical protein BDQ17DRAFT_1307895 [Cyathus striatus]|nr:hypothetical protein BDQ17DRAFT_1307895 [Cyathus striatus]